MAIKIERLKRDLNQKGEDQREFKRLIRSVQDTKGYGFFHSEDNWNIS